MPRISLPVQMLAGLIIGCAVGLLWPSVGKELFPVSRAFINALRMLIIPLVFSSIVLGIVRSTPFTMRVAQQPASVN